MTRRHAPLTDKDIEDIEKRDPFNAWICGHWVGLVDEEYEEKTNNAWAHQVMFLRDDVRHMFAAGMHYDDMQWLGRVISTHISKSITLPVVEFDRKDIGVRITLRNNFYNWKLSIESEKPIEAEFGYWAHTSPPIEPDYTGNPLASCYFEGFPSDRIFGYYSENNKKFSLEIGGKYDLMMVLHTLMVSLGIIKKRKWNTREEHKKELDAYYNRKSERQKEKERNEGV